MMKFKTLVTALLAASIGFATTAQSATLFQVSTYSALTQGVFDGDYTYKDLEKKGDFGLGTFNKIDGEMLALDGHFYQIKPDGSLVPANPKDKAPFANVTTFKPTFQFKVDHLDSYELVQQAIDTHFKNKNRPYAVKIVGTFDSLQLRDLKPQKRPYPKIAQVVKEQAIFNLKDTTGTAVGFWGPKFLSGVLAPGFHLHYVTKDLKTGGHILQAKLRAATVYVMPIDEVSVYLPGTQDFANADLSIENTKAAVEGLATKVGK